MILGYNTGVNLIKSSKVLQAPCYPFSTYVRGIDTVNYSTLPLFAFKVCKTCGEAKPLSEYHKGNDSDGLRHACKPCTNAQNRSIYEKNHDSHLEAKRRYRRDNPDARRATLQKHQEERKEQHSAYYAVKNAIKRGDLLAASDCVCAHCGAQAEVLHHWSYKREHWLDVKPLCRICHGKVHHAHVQ